MSKMMQKQPEVKSVEYATGEKLLDALLDLPITTAIAGPQEPVSEDFSKLMAGTFTLAGNAVQKSRRRCIKCLYCSACGSMGGPCGGAASSKAKWLDVEVDVPSSDRLYHQYSHLNCENVKIS